MSIAPHIRRIAAAYPDAAAHVPLAERERHFTPDQQAAWAWRFEGIEPDEFAILKANEVKA